MKIRLPVHAALWRYPHKQGEYILLKATNNKDNDLIHKLFATKKEWEERNQREFFLAALLELPRQHRTFRQNATVWKLVTVIFESLEGRLPDEEERYSLYLDLLDAYADKVPSRIKGGLRPIHISEANSLEGARFIDALLSHLASLCDLSLDLQATVQDVLQEWEQWRGGLEIDPIDFADLEQTVMLTEKEWREKHVYSEASGRGGMIQRAHIVSRGADAADIEKSWNWMALTPEEHEEQHRRGWDEFLRIYPHLRGRVERARKAAGRLELKALPSPRFQIERLVGEAVMAETPDYEPAGAIRQGGQ
jgi:hypothetical protein